MTGKVDDVRLPFSTVDPIMGDIYSVLWEPEMLQSIGDTINILATEALTQGLQQVLGSTILVALMSSLQLPLLLTKLAYLIDNPWNVSLDRASAAGLILADSLIDHNLGNRPVTLVGFSLGSRVIFSCLKELANKKALGLVQNVYMFGSPVVANKDEYLKARTAVSGRFVNGYASNDWILGYLFRATSGGIMRVAGLAPVQFPGVENVNVTEFVNGHMAYRTAMPKIMKHMGWEVESEEFAEIEEPDPENHAERQRELIREIDEARRVAKDEPDKKRFGLFKRGRLAKKKEWENYSVGSASAAGASPHLGSPDSRRTSEAGNGNVLFDIDAIRAELAAEHMDVRELQSTLPPMKLDLDAPQQLLSPQRAATTPDGLGVKNKEKEDVKEDTQGGRRRSTLTAAPSMTSLTPRGGLYDYDEEADADHTFSFSPVQGASKSPWDDPSPGHQHDDEVQLTFDTAFNEHHHDLDFPDAGGHGLDDVQLTFDTAFADDPGHGQAHDPGPDPFTSPPHRTSLHDDIPAKSSTTGLGLSGAGGIDSTGMASLDTVSPTKNVWAEEEDDLFGSGGRHGHDDGEIHMTFE
ncbi:Transmembrane and coiled-coil domain-containing protein 4 [Ascosphaera atra]|nr:Transmembrane and coiled-coil domain-containing protein 4 [Ascosphaera atra]